MIKIQDISLKIKYILKSNAFQKKPFTIIFRLSILVLALIIKKNISYKVFCNQSSFIYTFKNYLKSGLGGRGQFILRELYDPFFAYGCKLFNKKFSFIDVGCSRGFFSMYLLNLKNLKSTGISIEPLKDAIIDFKEILKLNKIKSVKIINGVISNQIKKKQPFYRVNDDLGYYSLFKDVRFADNKVPKKFFVQSYTIDQLIFKHKKLKKVDLIKIDSEGAEYEILTKSIKTINKFKPIIYCEITRKKNKIINFLKKNNYKLFILSDDKIYSFSTKYFTGDLLAIYKKSNLINNLND